MFYIRDEKALRDVSQEEILSAVTDEELIKRMDSFSDITIGIRGYQAEFNWDGVFLYPFDRDDSDNDYNFDSIWTPAEMAERLLACGPQVINAFEFLAKAPFEICVSDKYQNNDFPIRKVLEELQKQSAGW